MFVKFISHTYKSLLPARAEQGRDLLNKGQALEEDRRTLETEAAVKIHKIKSDCDGHIRSADRCFSTLFKNL